MEWVLLIRPYRTTPQVGISFLSSEKGRRGKSCWICSVIQTNLFFLFFLYLSLTCLPYYGISRLFLWIVLLSLRLLIIHNNCFQLRWDIPIPNGCPLARAQHRWRPSQQQCTPCALGCGCALLQPVPIEPSRDPAPALRLKVPSTFGGEGNQLRPFDKKSTILFS